MKILALMDFSETTTALAKVITKQAQHEVRQVRLLHILDLIVRPNSLGSLDACSNHLAKRKELMRTWVTKIAPELPNEVEMLHDVMIGDIKKSVREILAEYGPDDLIIMGSHGHGKIYDVLIGSCASTVLRHSQSPVLCIPSRALEYGDVLVETEIYRIPTEAHSEEEETPSE